MLMPFLSKRFLEVLNDFHVVSLQSLDVLYDLNFNLFAWNT